MAFRYKVSNLFALGGDFHEALGDECIRGHGTQILALAGTDRDSAVLHILGYFRSAYLPMREELGYKIREAQMQKIPYMLVIGDRVFGVPLDGGSSFTVVFQGKVLNSAKAGQRSVVDFVCFE